MHDFANVVTFIVFWLFVAAIVIVPQYFKQRDRQRMHETLRTAYEKGQPVPPELITALQTSPARVMDTPERDLRRAIVLIAVGLGMAGLGYGLWYGLASVGADEGGDVSGPIVAGVGAIPGMIGLAYLVLYFTRRQVKT